MSNLVAADFSKIEAVVLQGDLSRLSPQEKVNYYNRVCESVGLNPLTKPFDYMKLNGREILYARRDATDQLRKINSVSIKITARELVGDVYTVTAHASTKDGREDEATGAVYVKGLTGENIANAYMKAETKAKRRVTLSICGLGFMDETEAEDITPEEREAKAREITAKLEAENFKHQVPHDAPPPAAEVLPPETVADYLIKVGKNAGKRIKDLSGKQVNDFLRWFEEKKKAGENMHPDVTEYAEKLQQFLEENGDVP